MTGQLLVADAAQQVRRLRTRAISARVLSADGSGLVALTLPFSLGERTLDVRLHVHAYDVAAPTDRANFDISFTAHRDVDGALSFDDEVILNGPFKDQAAWDITYQALPSAITVSVNGEVGKKIVWEIDGTVHESGGLILDLIDTANLRGAWSMSRRLSSFYSGPLFRVRRLNDNAETDIGFDFETGWADRAALRAFVPAGVQAEVPALYDQSGQSNDIYEVLAPFVFDPSPIEQQGRQAALGSYDTSRRFAKASDLGFSGNPALTVCMVLKSNGYSTPRLWGFTDSFSVPITGSVYEPGDVVGWTFPGVGNVGFGSASPLNVHRLCWRRAAGSTIADLEMFRNGIALAQVYNDAPAGVPDLTSATQFYVEADQSFFHEFLIFEDELSDDTVAAIDADQATVYPPE